MPVTDLCARLDPPPPPDVQEAAARLRYRDFLTVCVIVDQAEVFPDNWIYVHDPEVRVGRIQNFKNWSPDMVPDPGKTSLGLEYFCTEGDDLWRRPDAELVDLARRELARMGLVRPEAVVDGCVVRTPKAYPIYDASYRDHLARVRRFVDGLDNLQTVGRNGLHRYNNQDHAMLTGILAARNLVLGTRHDLWSVNADQAYHEEVRTPEAGSEILADLERTVTAPLGRLDEVAFAVAVGLAAGIGLGALTLGLALAGESVVFPFVRLLDEYLPGYTVTLPGSVLGVTYGAAGGVVAGGLLAVIRNAAVGLHGRLSRRRLERLSLRRLLE
jgi:hypothetical protein